MQQIIDFLSKQTRFHLKAEGKSMLPLIFSNDVVYVKKCRFASIKSNDIVLVKKSKKTFIHRVIYKNNNSTYLITKGDSNLVADGRIYPSQVIGRVFQIKRNGQIFNPETIYLLQSTLYFQEIVKIKKELEKEKIDFVFLKGLPIHLFLEKSYPQRIYADCDLLIASKDYTRTAEILKRIGFQIADTSLSHLHKFLKDKPTEVTFFKEINNFPVLFDIHFEIIFLMNQIGKLETLYPQKLIEEMTKQFLQEKQSVMVQKEHFSILTYDNLVIYLMLHFFHHNFKGIFRLQLLNRIIVTRRINWIKLTDKIKYYQLQNFIYPVLLLLQKYFATPLGKNFLNSIQPKSSILHYIEKEILPSSVFDEETRIQAGKERFSHIFYLSPRPILFRLLVLSSPAVLYSLFWVVYQQFKKKLQNLW